MRFLSDLQSRILQSLGLVFGDIGTSPIYTIGVILLFILPIPANILGMLSLIIWTLFIVITVQYTWLAMHISSIGEGGTIVLKEVLLSLLKPDSRLIPVISVLTILGIALFIGDSVITPAISILSAVEGILLIPGFEQTGGGLILLIAVIIATALFFIQRRGTEKIAFLFGPVMLLWFVTLTVTGIIAIISYPQILLALSPTYAFVFLFENGLTSLFVMSAVILCVTGGEALYADMGHLGCEPIIKGWYCVFPALVLSYLGQGAFVLQHPETHNVLFSMFNYQLPFLYIPFLLLSICATVIASQAMISGLFSIVYQGMTTHILPRMKIEYTSPELRSQIYIDTVNWMMLAAVIVVMLEFRSSENLAAAYGLAVAGTMLISSIMMTMIYILRHDPVKWAVAAALIVVDTAFFLSSFLKIPHGAYWSFIMAAIPLLIIVAYIQGQKKLHTIQKPVDIESFLPQYAAAYRSLPKIRGTALYFMGDTRHLSPYIEQIFFKNEILYENNILVSIQTRDAPFGVTTELDTNLGHGLHVFTVNAGYMEVVDITGLLRSRGIDEKTIFYGVENIVSESFMGRVYGIIKKNSPPFVQFYALPQEKIHGVVTRVEM